MELPITHQDLVRLAWALVTRRPYVYVFLPVALAYTLVYFVATGMIIYAPWFDISTVAPVPYYSIEAQRLSFLEPMFLAYPTKHLVIAIPWSGAATALLLGTLVGINVVFSLALRGRSKDAAKGFVGAVGAVPSIFAVACCGGPVLWAVAAFAGPAMVALLGSLSWALTGGSFLLLGASAWWLGNRVQLACCAPNVSRAQAELRQSEPKESHA